MWDICIETRVFRSVSIGDGLIYRGGSYVIEFLIEVVIEQDVLKNKFFMETYL